MDTSPPPPRPTAEALFADFLDRVEAGGDEDFETFCGQHPAAAAALRKIHVRWQAMSRAFTHLSQDSSAGAAAAPSKGVDDLKARLASPGGRLARYALREEIARGAMGRIVSAWDEELRREVALKIHRGALDDHRQQRRFLEEAQIAAQLDHPGIVAVHELGVDEAGRPFFAMQRVRGQDLGQILAAVAQGSDDWSRTRVLSVLLRVCEAMAFAHEKGVVHRDLKPANIMVGRFGETYVMDWGLAHVQTAAAPTDDDPVATLRATIHEEDADSALLTRHGDVLGTPAYMAPEQAVGGKSVAPAVDIYSVGAILYHLLAGDMPYAAAAPTGDAVLQALRAGPPPPLRDDVPPELQAICERAMAREPAARYATMLELASNLRAFLEVRTVRAYATGRFAELQKWVLRNRALAAVLGLFAIAVVTATIALGALWVRADADRRRADAGAERLQTELDRSTFQRARQAMQLANSTQAADTLWRAHCQGRMPRATFWALKELAARDPYLVSIAGREDLPVAFTSDGDFVLIGGRDGKLQLRDPRTLAVVATIGDGGARIVSVAGLATGRAVAGTAAGDLLLADLATRTVAQRLHAHEGSVTSLCATTTGLASAGADGRALWWQGFDRTPLTVLTHTARLTAVAVRPNQDGLVAGSTDGTLLGAAFDGSWKFSRKRAAESLASLAFTESPDQLWLGDTGQQVRRYDFTTETAQWLHWTQNGTCRQLVPTGDGSVLLGGWWRVDRWSGDGTQRQPVSLRPISRMALAPDRRWLATTSTVCGLGIVDLAPMDRRTLPTKGAVAISGDGRLVAVSGGNHMSVRDVATGALRYELPKGSNGWVMLNGDGSLCAVNRPAQSTLNVYETKTGTLLYKSDGPPGGSGFTFRFSPDDSELAFAVGPDHWRRVRASDGELIAEYSWPGARIIAMAWSADGRSLAVAARGQTAVRVYELATGATRDEDFAHDWPAGMPVTFSAVALSPDGSSIAVGSMHGPIRVRRRDGSTLPLAGHDGTVWSLHFGPQDPGLLLSSGGAQGLACWDLESGECCYQAFGDQASQLQVSADGTTLSCMTPNGALLLDLSYHDRHTAGNLEVHLATARAQGTITPEREQELRAWASTVMARPWPRWQ